MHYKLFFQFMVLCWVFLFSTGCGNQENKTAHQQEEEVTTVQNKNAPGKSICGGIETGRYVLTNDPKISMTITARGEKYLVIVFIDGKEYQDNLYVCDSEMMVSINELICIRNVGGNKIKTGNHFTGESFFYTKVDSM